MSAANALAREVAGDLGGRGVSFIWNIKSLASLNDTRGHGVPPPQQGYTCACCNLVVHGGGSVVIFVV